MYLYTDLYDPADLTGYAREAAFDQAVNASSLDRWLPNRVVDDLDYRFTAGGEGLIEAASFRSFDTPAPFGSRVGKKRVSGELPPISRKIRLGEYERLKSRGHAALQDQVERDAERMSGALAARMRLAIGEALYSGKVQIAENGVVATADFGRSAGHTVTAATPWTTIATADVLTDLTTWADAYEVTNGVRPEAALTSRRVQRLMQRNQVVINAIAGDQTGRTRVNLAELQELLQSEGLPTIYTDETKAKVGNTATRAIPDDRLILLPAPGDPNDPESSELGASLWGTTAESLEAEYGIEDADKPGIVAGTYKSEDPINYWTKASGIGLPVLANPDLSFCADVA